MSAVQTGEQASLNALLAEDAVLIADAGKEGGSYGRIRNVGKPVVGRTRIAALLGSFIRQDVPRTDREERTLNGEPAMVIYQNGHPFAVVMISVADGFIRHVFVQVDPERLRRLGPAH